MSENTTTMLAEIVDVKFGDVIGQLTSHGPSRSLTVEISVLECEGEKIKSGKELTIRTACHSTNNEVRDVVDFLKFPTTDDINSLLRHCSDEIGRPGVIPEVIARIQEQAKSGKLWIVKWTHGVGAEKEFNRPSAQEIYSALVKKYSSPSSTPT